MSNIHANKDQVTSLIGLSHEGPVRMLNLLRFRTEKDGEGLTGSEVYDRYLRNVAPVVAGVGGRVILAGSVLTTVIGPTDEKWDRMLIVEYPSLRVFTEMSQSATYRAVAHDRTEALADSRLLALG